MGNITFERSSDVFVMMEDNGLVYNADHVARYYTRKELKHFAALIDRTMRVYDKMGWDDDTINRRNQELIEKQEQERYDEMMTKANTPKEEKPQSLYVIKDHSTNGLKVGKSASPLKRFNQIQIASSNHLTLEAIFDECGYMENDIHEALKNAGQHMRGEWFKDTDATWQIIKEFCDYE